MGLRKLATYIAAWAAGLATTGLAGLVIIYTGAFNATATKPHEPIVAWATHAAFIHSVRVRAGAVEAPAKFTRAQAMAGLADYDGACVACHGGPGVGRASFASAMNPTPPYLLDAARRWTPAQLYWIIHEGVKMTGMPAWGETQSDARVWNLVAFLEAMPSITATDYARLRVRQPGSSSSSLSSSSPAPR